VHVAITSSSPSGTVTFSDDASADGGRQSVTIGGTEHATILLIGGIGYVKGNQSALASFIGLPSAQAQQDAGRWIEVRDGDHLGATSYSDLVDGITLSSVAGELGMKAPYTATGTSSVAGQRVIAVRAHAPAGEGLPAAARVVFYVTDDNQARPVSTNCRARAIITTRCRSATGASRCT
jgi:hypothetical protein